MLTKKLRLHRGPTEADRQRRTGTPEKVEKLAALLLD